jgi:SnoaL-like domain
VSQELVERFLAAIDAWNRCDREAWLDFAADEWRTSGTFPGIDPVYRGREGMITLWQYLREPSESPPDRRVAGSLQIEVERVEDLGDTVVGLSTFQAQGERTAANITQKVGYVLADDNGYLRLTTYMSWDEALEAVGLRE